MLFKTMKQAATFVWTVTASEEVYRQALRDGGYNGEFKEINYPRIGPSGLRISGPSTHSYMSPAERVAFTYLRDGVVV